MRVGNNGDETNVAKLILIKHAKPLVMPGVPSERWALSDEGRRACGPLAERVRAHGPRVVVASEEPKAAETGRLLADAIGAAFETAAGLHEHDRSNVPHLATRAFISAVALLFKRPDELVLGRETAAAALERFARAVDAVLARHAGQDVAVVTHGTVLALYAAGPLGADPFALWRTMGLPSFVVLEMPGRRAVGGVESVG